MEEVRDVVVDGLSFFNPDLAIRFYEIRLPRYCTAATDKQSNIFCNTCVT